MVDPQQSPVVAFLRSCLAGQAEEVLTHGSHLLLGRDRVFKLKRPVSLGYLDHSTPQNRLRDCEAEVRLNRRTAPALYLGVHRITRMGEGLAMDGDGELVDAVVEMRRFPAGCLLEDVARRGGLSREILTRLAHALARLHRDAPAVQGQGAARMAGVLAINARAFAQTGLIQEPVGRDLPALSHAELARHVTLLDYRARAGKIRRGHGDLTLRNICLIDGEPVLFDCLEFDDELATTDVLYDLAFLLMDLWHRGLQDAANWLMNRYLDELDESDGLVLLPFFMAVRAMVRAHVAESLAKSGGDGGAHAEALVYAATSQDLLYARSPRCIAIGGFSGSGKSTMAASLASHVGAAPGARILSSDRIRKARFGVPAGERLPQTAYAPDVSQAVYGEMFERAALLLSQGSSVVLDAVFDRAEDRAQAKDMAERAGVAFNGLWLDAPRALAASRISARRGDPSDATVAVHDLQRANGHGVLDWIILDSARSVQSLVSSSLTMMEI